MTEKNNSSQRLDTLLGTALDGELTETERAELNTVLRSDADARRRCHALLDLHTELEWMLNPEMLENPIDLSVLSAPPSGLRISRRSKIIAAGGWTALAASLLILLGLFFSDYNSFIVVDPAGARAQHGFVARANYSGSARLSGNSTVLRQEEWLSPGSIILEEGTLGLTFDSGARIVLNAPASFDLETANRGFLHAGQAVAQVPQAAAGFIINTPNGTLVDLGTEFAVNVDRLRSSVKVIKGEVLAYAETAAGRTEERLLRKDDAVHIAKDAAAAFSPAADFLPEPFHDWTRFYQPDADYIHFTFEDEGGAARTSSAWGRGAKIKNWSAAPEQGSLPESRIGVFGGAMRFDGEGAYLRTGLDGIPGDLPRTVACWIKVPPGEHDTAISMVSWGIPRRGGRWQIGLNHDAAAGTIGSIRTDFGKGYVTGSTDLRDGRWHHIVSVYIGGNSADLTAHIRHYVDGKLEAVSHAEQGRTRINTLVKEGWHPDNLTIGYRATGGRGPIRSFKGSMDELYLFNAAILPSQIENLIRHNDPNLP